MHCLLFLQDSIDKYVQSLLKYLHHFKEEQQAEVEDLKNNIPCDNDDESEPIEYMTLALKKVL